MTGGLSRRDLMVMASATAAFAAKERCLRDGQVPLDIEARRGFDDNWGQDPHGPPKYEKPVTPVYLPKFIAVAIVNFRKKWMVDVHHASFELAPQMATNPAYRCELAVALISWVIKENKKLGELSSTQTGENDHLPYKRKYGNHAGAFHISSFRDFSFLSQNEVFIFLRNKDIALNSKRLIRFTRYSDTNDEMDLNYSFFNAKEATSACLGDLAKHGKLIRVENHVTNCDGSPTIEKTHYSMNVHFRMRVKPEGSEREYIPMVIDPDTGNGAGNEP
jgi:hypothetical protein